MSTTSATSPIIPYKNGSSSDKPVYENNIAKALNGINICNGHKNLLISEHSNFPNETETSMSMTIISATTALNVKEGQSKQL